VVTNEHEGRIYLRAGKVYYAVIDDAHDLGPKKSFNRIIMWEVGEFELRPPDTQRFVAELDSSTEGLLMEALRQLDEYRRIQPKLPPPTQPLVLASPLSASLRDLTPDELDVLQLTINWGTLRSALDHSEQDDVKTAEVLLGLMERGYVVAG
jgi:hypothetical protein